MRKQQTVTINNVTFTVVGQNAHFMRPTYEARNIFYAYKNPSAEKIRIWEDWQKWADTIADNETDITCCDIWVSSKNAQFFSIGGEITYNNGKTAHITITACKHNIWY